MKALRHNPSIETSRLWIRLGALEEGQMLLVDAPPDIDFVNRNATFQLKSECCS